MRTKLLATILLVVSTLTLLFLFPSTASSQVLAIGHTAVYERRNIYDSQIWVATRINETTIVFFAWRFPLWTTNIVWRSSSKEGILLYEDPTEIHYDPVTFYDSGVPADTYGNANGPYGIWLTETALYLSPSGGPYKYYHATRIGYGALLAWYTRQWCGPNSICPASPGDAWPGHPLWFVLMQEANTYNVTMMIIGPWQDPNTGAGRFDIGQGELVTPGLLLAHSATFCSYWTNKLGLCAEARPVFEIKSTTAQWWFDTKGVVGALPDCNEFSWRHGVAIKVTDRDRPTSEESTWQGSTEGNCFTNTNALNNLTNR